MRVAKRVLSGAVVSAFLVGAGIVQASDLPGIADCGGNGYAGVAKENVTAAAAHEEATLGLISMSGSAFTIYRSEYLFKLKDEQGKVPFQIHTGEDVTRQSSGVLLRSLRHRCVDFKSDIPNLAISSPRAVLVSIGLDGSSVLTQTDGLGITFPVGHDNHVELSSLPLPARLADGTWANLLNDWPSVHVYDLGVLAATDPLYPQFTSLTNSAYAYPAPHVIEIRTYRQTVVDGKSYEETLVMQYVQQFPPALASGH